ncbi:hypothetical protein CAPTEDRAFT_190285 [Capitella teleta]|uniref:Reverse transcriptase domain-containing protein n=1 Tax=Capitella teleta TaxID=283909 RepID=R7V5I1_CAPTE|nr:hypothetical protein CAPTEDRAFT_190285 [Capitella teleta]|eukprot:ELU13702.1 hypothetical protein CAPTEDRAFT_190285 [Capitella teleta]
MVVMLGSVSVLHTVIVAVIANEGLIGSQFLSCWLKLKHLGHYKQELVWMVEPPTKTPGGRPKMVTRTITSGNGSALPTELLNPFDENILQYKGTTFGEALPALPEELEKVIKDSTMELKKGNRDVVWKLIENSRAIIASKQSPYGQTTIIQHGIETGHQTPISQAVCRPPFHIRAEAETEVEKMLKSAAVHISEHMDALEEIFKRLMDAGLKLKPKKCNLLERKL